MAQLRRREGTLWRGLFAPEVLLAASLAAFGLLYSAQWAFYSVLGLSPDEAGASYQRSLTHLALLLVALAVAAYFGALLGVVLLFVDYLLSLLFWIVVIFLTTAVLYNFGYVLWLALVWSRVRQLYRRHQLHQASRMLPPVAPSGLIRKTRPAFADVSVVGTASEGPGEALSSGGRSSSPEAASEVPWGFRCKVRLLWRRSVTREMRAPLLSLVLFAVLAPGAFYGFRESWPSALPDLPSSDLVRAIVWLAFNLLVLLAFERAFGVNWVSLSRRARAVRGRRARGLAAAFRVLILRSMLVRWFVRRVPARYRALLVGLFAYLLLTAAVMLVMVNSAERLSADGRPSIIQSFAMDVLLVQRPRSAVLTPTDCTVMPPAGVRWGAVLLWLGTSSSGHVVRSGGTTAIVSADYASLSLTSHPLPDRCAP